MPNAAVAPDYRGRSADALPDLAVFDRFPSRWTRPAAVSQLAGSQRVRTHVYDLIPREALFHGVEALRLIPVGGEGAIFGRTGLLTHTYLLGPRGDSNGCISFKDYEAFLRAYKNGKVKRMVVVASIDDPQLDLQLVERRPGKTFERTVQTETVSIKTTPQTDDRYLSAFSSSLASRTN